MTAEAATTTNQFLQGLLRPTMDERDADDLEIVGDLPGGLQGIFTRNGPNPQFEPIGAYHPFDGDGMVHAVYFEDGKARYRNRWIESKGLLLERKRGKACYGSVSEFRLPDDDIMAEGGMMKNNANTHYVRHAGRYLALMEAGLPTELSRELETIGEYNFGGKLEGSMTAHPKMDPKTGEMVFFGYSPFPPYVTYHVADASGALVHSAVIDIPKPIMMHDFVMTENYAVFYDTPAMFDVEAMMQGKPGTYWSPERGARLGVVPRRGTNDDVRWFEVEPSYAVHFFNAYEDGNKIVIDAPTFDRMPGGLQFDAPEQTEEPLPHRWVIDLDAGSASYKQTDDQSGEFPRINDKRAGLKARYMYNSTARNWQFGFDFNGVIKYDTETGKSTSYTHPDPVVVGEHVFVPDPSGSAEDDGWLMTLGTDRATEKTELLILDARNVEDGPISRVQMPHRVPIGFHANWMAE